MPNAYTRLLLQLLAMLLAVAPSFSAWSATAWTFAVSGDSRNCGNVVMPAIGAAVHANGDRFYWNLGDLQWTRGMDEDYWRDPRHGGVVLPGWIVGTAGAVRYPLPLDVTPGPDARSHVYGTLTGRVDGAGEVAFRFHELDEVALQRSRSADYEAADVAFCFAENPPLERLGSSPPAPSCLAHDHEN